MKRLVKLVATVAFCAQAHATTSTSTATATMPMTMASPASTVSVSAAKAGAKKKKVTVNYTAETIAPAESVNKSNWTGAVESQSHVGIAYDLGNDRKIQVRQYYLYNMTDGEKPNESDLGDHVVQYTDKTMAKIGNADMLFYARLYLPGSEHNREVGKYEMRLLQSVTQQITSKFSLEYALGTRFYAYSSDNDGQRGFRALPAIGSKYEINKYVAPFANVYTDNSWLHSGEGISLATGKMRNPENHSSSFVTEFGSEFNIGSNANINLYMITERDTTKSADYNPFRDENNSYELDLTVTY